MNAAEPSAREVLTGLRAQMIGHRDRLLASAKLHVAKGHEGAGEVCADEARGVATAVEMVDAVLAGLPPAGEGGGL